MASKEARPRALHRRVLATRPAFELRDCCRPFDQMRPSRLRPANVQAAVQAASRPRLVACGCALMQACGICLAPDPACGGTASARLQALAGLHSAPTPESQRSPASHQAPAGPHPTQRHWGAGQGGAGAIAAGCRGCPSVVSREDYCLRPRSQLSRLGCRLRSHKCLVQPDHPTWNLCPRRPRQTPPRPTAGCASGGYLSQFQHS